MLAPCSLVSFDQPDPRLRGVCIYRTESNAKARELATSDPAVRAGQLQIEVMGWRTRPDALQAGRNGGESR